MACDGIGIFHLKGIVIWVGPQHLEACGHGGGLGEHLRIRQYVLSKLLHPAGVESRTLAQQCVEHYLAWERYVAVGKR